MRVAPDPNRGLYTLLSGLTVRCRTEGSEPLEIEVPKGFQWDGASIPRVAWSAIGYTPFHPRLMRASCVHDWLYTQQNGSRRAADELFRQLLIEDGVLEHAAGTMYRAVREFGDRIWQDEEDLRREAELAEIQENRANN